MIEAIFFDFNGVVINDEPLKLKAYQEALTPEGIKLSEDDYYSGLGMDDVTFLHAMFERAGVTPEQEVFDAVMERKTARHLELLGDGELPLFPGVVTFVKALARRYPLGLVSMATRAEIDYAMKRAALANAFSVVVSAEDVTACKPDPQCYTRAFDKLNEQRSAAHVLPFLPEECLVIEDSPPGIRAGRAAGMRTLGVTNTVSDEALREAGAHVVTGNLADWTVDALHHVFDEWHP